MDQEMLKALSEIPPNITVSFEVGTNVIICVTTVVIGVVVFALGRMSKRTKG